MNRVGNRSGISTVGLHAGKHSFQLFLLVIFLLSACVHLIAPYDADTQRTTFECAKSVDQFYGRLLETNEQNRTYSVFADQYVSVESELNSLLLRNKVRAMNKDAIDIADQILKFWQKYRAGHRKADTYSTGNAELDRGRFARLFAYAVRAEDAKKP